MSGYFRIKAMRRNSRSGSRAVECKRGHSALEPGVGGVLAGLASGDQGRRAHGLERRDGLGDKRRLLLDDGVIDRRAETFVQDFYAEQFGGGGGAVLVGAGDGDIEGQDLIAEPGEGGFFFIFFIGGAPPPAFRLDRISPL
jgi:hypothetical protein